MQNQLDTRLFAMPRAEPVSCPVCGTPLADGARQYFGMDGSAAGCDACITVRWC